MKYLVTALAVCGVIVAASVGAGSPSIAGLELHHDDQPGVPQDFRMITYSIDQRGDVDTDVEAFRSVVGQILADNRGWSVKSRLGFKEVSTGGDFTMWIAGSRSVPTFSSDCDAEWSCQAGRNVVINDKRWLNGSPTLDMSLLDYRRLVVNHELGHWLGLGHVSCSGPGQPASVMQQQSKPSGLGDCVPNVWPFAHDRQTVLDLKAYDGSKA